VVGCTAGVNFWQSSYMLSVRATAAAAGRMGFSVWIYFVFSFRYSRYDHPFFYSDIFSLVLLVWLMLILTSLYFCKLIFNTDN